MKVYHDLRMEFFYIFFSKKIFRFIQHKNEDESHTEMIKYESYTKMIK